MALIDGYGVCFTCCLAMPWVRSVYRVYRYQSCMPGATNNVLSDGNDTNDYNTSTLSSSLSASTTVTAVVVVYP